MCKTQLERAVLLLLMPYNRILYEGYWDQGFAACWPARHSVDIILRGQHKALKIKFKKSRQTVLTSSPMWIVQNGDITEVKCGRLGQTQESAFIASLVLREGLLVNTLWQLQSVVGSGKSEILHGGNGGASAPAYPLPASCGSSALGTCAPFFSRWFWFLS